MIKTIKEFIVNCGPMLGTTILFCILMLILALAFIALNILLLVLCSTRMTFALFLYIAFGIGVTLLTLFFAHCWYLKLCGAITIVHKENNYVIYKGSRHSKPYRTYANRDELIKALPKILD